MMSKKSPQLRFEGFTDDWEERKLGEVGYFYYGKSAPKWSVTEDAETPCVRYGELYTKYGAKISNIYSHTNINPKNLKFSTGNEVLVPRVGENPLDFSLCSWLSIPNVAIGEMISVYNTNENPLFISYYFRGQMKYEFAKRVEGGNVSNLYYSYLEDIDLYIPKLEEQIAISKFFEKLDDTIALHQRKLDLLKEQKKGYLQKMFPKNGEKVPELRFAGFADDWEERKLKDIAQFNPKTVLPDEFEYVDLESVVGTEMISHRTESKDQAPSRAQRLAQKGDVFYQTVRPYQMNNYLYDLPYDNYVFSTGYAQMRPNIDSYFLLNSVQNKQFVQHVLDRSTGTSYPAINSSDLSKIEIHVPSKLSEQQKIGAFFQSIDDTIALHQRKLDLLKEQKKGFLQKMFV